MSKINRRDLLVRAWKWGFGLVSVAAAWTTWDMFKPSNASGFGTKVSAGPADSVPIDNVTEVPAMRGYLTTDKGEAVALWWKCPHLGCRVPWCDSSGEFECPCHGSVFNRVGEWREGPAPRGLDRFSMQIVDGVVEVDTGSVITGPPHGPETIDEPVRGPKCEGTEDA
ncbi:ubiquinol-cytochrome c reductase iron-sulfur subunit [bacterium BMS3Abin02]|nr:ubiquinol-cytochrome c reductase iron-sulfur subunit [bacterium BMS3Abin02]GBE22144.1 ubiquinol-cytochrome c reductase iron-sulfur subunit [bacterium BMS3Bbin01]HDH25530.1 Rieske (2Fe-2S) protein [Actinomycetota bacterium]HDK44682.1 Rieske (2Fe-2S) protein [Actinomycetota bacterium]HDL50123.1 Rieske (2Fe-2S) protein [Actinomycetota bacterium]